MAGSVVTPAKHANAAAPGATQSGQRKPIQLVLLFAAVILGVAAVQIVVTYLLMPGAAHSEIKQKHDEKEHAAHGRRDSEHETVAGDFAEVALGDFSFSNTTAMRNAITHVNFKLAALVSSNEASILEAQIVRNQERIREAVNKIVRNSNLEELYDPNLETIKRLICEEINGLLGRRMVMEVVINDVRVIQQ